MSQAEPLFSGFPAVDNGKWKSRVLEELKGADYSKIVWKTPEGFAMEPWYNRQTALPSPAVPFDRSSNRWRICQQITVTDPVTASAAAEAALSGGADAIEFLFDSDVNYDAARLALLLQHVDLAKVPVYFSGTIGNAPSLLENLSGLPGFASNSGGILHDALTADQGTIPFAAAGLRPAGFRTLAVDTTRFHKAGATITQEIAIALAGVSEYLSRLTDQGIDAGEAAATLEIVFAAGTSHFPELSKLRALRAMWPQLLDAYGITSSRPEPRIYVRASHRASSMLDPYTNILRLSTEAVSAILGGCDTLQLDSFDPAGSVSEELSERITRNIHLLLKEESGLDRVVDPAAGSWYIDTMTASICREAWKLFQQIETAGGLLQAESNGLVASMIAPAADAQKKALHTRKRSLIGINRYTVPPAADVVEASVKAAAQTGEALSFEQLRLRLLTNSARTGVTPRAALWLHGDPSKSLRVAAFAEDFLRCGGFEVANGVSLDLVTKSCRSILADEPDIVVFCWTGDEDLGSVPAICATIQELRKETVVIMAAKPPENAGDLLKAGVDQFIYTGCDAYSSLLSLQHKTGVL
ncbi:MAG TPA: methylmalonyl-CoA mutase family protein [Chlorobaculum sp.]|nr:methylmalonyl-CoA mutase family protein [Chlorobaculum sp.]